MNRILLVEDNPDEAEITLSAFRASAPDVDLVVVADGLSALAYLAENERPDVIFLDLKLPGMSGLHVLRAIRGNPATASIPVVVLTSSDEQQDIARSYEAGANSYVRKPVDFDRLLDLVALLARYWLHANLPLPRPR